MAVLVAAVVLVGLGVAVHGAAAGRIPWLVAGFLAGRAGRRK